MGISRSTVLVLQAHADEIKCEWYERDGKYGVYIWYPHINPLITSEPVFETADAAQQQAKELFNELLGMDALAT